MFRSVNGIKGYELQAIDGRLGSCQDLLWDDRDWVIRYLVADTGRWLPGRKVVISPISLGAPEWKYQRIPVELTKAQIERAPNLDEHAPVSRQYELQWSGHFRYSHYWAGPGIWGAGDVPVKLRDAQESAGAAADAGEGDAHLRSADEVAGYAIEAVDGEIGHVEDFIVDDRTWRISSVVVDTRNWLPGGRKVLLLPLSIDAADWRNEKLTVDLTRETVENSPEFDPREPINREYEERLYDYYGRPVLT